MKKISFWFLIAFSFFFIGELIWSIRLLSEDSILGTEHLDEWMANIMFMLCAITGFIGSYKWYQKS